jgi:N-acetylmuramoyl-L-alanine amidase
MGVRYLRVTRRIFTRSQPLPQRGAGRQVMGAKPARGEPTGPRSSWDRVQRARPPLGCSLIVLILVMALAWTVMTCAAAENSRPTRSKPRASAKGTQSGGATSVPAPLWRVRDIRHWSNPNYTRVVIDVDGEVQYRFGRLVNPDRLYVDLLGAQLASPLQGRSLDVSDPFLKGVRGAQNQPDVVRVVLDLKTLRDYHIFTMNDPYRLVIDIKGTGSGTSVQPPPPPPPPRPQAAGSEQNSLRTDPPAALKRQAAARDQRWHVVIDAGHGGKDPGAIGPSGLMEKEVVLDIARRLRELMRQDPQWRVTLTRDHDVFLPLEERTAIANAKGADLFVSIHANSAERPDAHGIETYFLDLASDEQSMRVAARENATTVSKVSDLQRILRDLQMTSKRNESSLLAGSVQQALVQVPSGGKNGRDLGVKHAPFLVLMGAEMPSILVETGFVSNPGEERKLANSKYRAQAARAIFDGIKEYLASANGSGARQVQR